MSGPSSAGGSPVTSKRQLIEYLERGCKPREAWRIGTEHEKFVYDLKGHRPLAYEGRPGIRALLEGLERYGWEPVLENANIIALRMADGCSITLEPGGQFELSGAPLQNIHQTCSEVNEHLRQVKEVCGEMGAGMIGLGFQPKAGREDISWMPKGRYAIMRRYMPTRGALGLDMMTRTCTVQVNLDFSSEADMVKKFRVALALQPVATALFANSPFSEGRPNGYLSYRSQVWTDTDPDRSGMLPFVFEDGFGFERWVDYLLDVPMYFVYRDGSYIDVAGRSFRDFMAGRLEGFDGEPPGIGDWADHITTAFPEVRLKHYLEMRGADGGPWGRLCALPALWVGLLYDDAALEAAWDLCRDWSMEEREMLRAEAPRTALKTPFRAGTLQDLAKEVLAVARQGLTSRAAPDHFGEDEAHFLNELHEIAETGITPAEQLLDAYEHRWNGSIEPLFDEYAY
ncbi:MAG: glutamate--cysteine ligase [Rhodospirillales bacterium]|nr:MAG: glutamate--cysteine ligase [Rhodospirillales bacterium]